MKYIFIIIIISVNFLYSHPGRLDSSGGHRDNSTGEYHYHRQAYQSTSSKSRVYTLNERQGLYKSDKDDIIIEIIENGQAIWKENTNETKFSISYGKDIKSEYKINLLIRNREYKDVILKFLNIDTFTITLDKNNIYIFKKFK